MADMLVKLYALSDVAPVLAKLKQQGIEIRQAHPPDKNTISEWVRQHFGDRGQWQRSGLPARSCVVLHCRKKEKTPATGSALMTCLPRRWWVSPATMLPPKACSAPQEYGRTIEAEALAQPCYSQPCTQWRLKGMRMP